MSLTKFCNAQGCRNLCAITERYCQDHAYLIAEQEAKRQSAYDRKVRHGRDERYTAFYHSPEWEAKRDYIIAKYDGLDVYAYYINHKLMAATLPHHIEPLREAWHLRLTDSNLIPVSAKTHKGDLERLYKKDKAGTQMMLRGLLKRWEDEFHP